MKISTIKEELNSLAYHGRGIIIGKSAGIVTEDLEYGEILVYA